MKDFLSDNPIEIERKFLIKLPSVETLSHQKSVRIKNIVQTYLTSEKDVTLRIRKITEGEAVSYVKTEKRRISSLSCYEDESEITKEEYEVLLRSADRSKKNINKTRYAFEYGGHIIEIDIYGFWDDRAILEIELKSEGEQFTIPEFVEILKEVTEDKRYKNTNLANSVPYDKI